MNALLDYGSSSSNDTDEENPDEKPTEEASKPKLPKPTIGENALQTSVFSNPFVEAELAKAAILEKHVKMVPGKAHTNVINGKKICWNHRKGKCRFGHNCKYAHDSDIQRTAQELQAEKEMQRQKSVVCEGAGTQTSGPPPLTLDEPVSNTDDAVWEGAPERKKRRPGLSKTLVPGKRVMQMYKDQKNRNSFQNKS